MSRKPVSLLKDSTEWTRLYPRDLDVNKDTFITYLLEIALLPMTSFITVLP